MTRLSVALVLLAAYALGSNQVLAQANEQGGRPLTASLTGEAVVPGPGDTDGTGTAELTLNQGQGEICVEITLENVEMTAAHIHTGAAGESGGVVVPLVSGTDTSGCVEADKEVIMAIRQNPAAYYVQVHNAEFPGGAVRGQLSK